MLQEIELRDAVNGKRNEEKGGGAGVFGKPSSTIEIGTVCFQSAARIRKLFLTILIHLILILSSIRLNEFAFIYLIN